MGTNAAVSEAVELVTTRVEDGVVTLTLNQGDRFNPLSTRMIAALKAGLAPVSIAMLVATAWILAAQMPARGPVAVAIGAALLTWRTRLHLLWMIGAGALLGALGVL